MASLNKVFLMGNVTRDPEIRYTTGGAALCILGLAINRKFTTSKGEEREETCFVDIEVWGKQAESCHNYLRKGSPVFVEGRLKFDQWDDRETGRKRSRLLVNGERVQFLGAPARSAGYDDTTPSPSSSAIPSEFQQKIVPEPPPFPTNDLPKEGHQSTSPASRSEEEPMDDIPF